MMCRIQQIADFRGQNRKTLMINQRLRIYFRLSLTGFNQKQLSVSIMKNLSRSKISVLSISTIAGIAQLGKLQAEDLKVACSIHAHCIFLSFGTAVIYFVHCFMFLYLFRLCSTVPSYHLLISYSSPNCSCRFPNNH